MHPSLKLSSFKAQLFEMRLLAACMYKNVLRARYYNSLRIFSNRMLTSNISEGPCLSIDSIGILTLSLYFGEY